MEKLSCFVPDQMMTEGAKPLIFALPKEVASMAAYVLEYALQLAKMMRYSVLSTMMMLVAHKHLSVLPKEKIETDWIALVYARLLVKMTSFCVLDKFLMMAAKWWTFV